MNSVTVFSTAANLLIAGVKRPVQAFVLDFRFPRLMEAEVEARKTGLVR
jgi:hypothetical protein